jgi:hypothetical protein
MDFALLGWPPDGPTLRLDYRRFAYAGKFVLESTGKAVVRESVEPRATGSSVEPRATGSSVEPRATGSSVEPRATGNRPEADEDGEYDEGVLAAASFDPDRTDDTCLVVRYVTVRDDRQGEGLGSRLLAFVAARASDRGYDRVRIAVNNPTAYVAAHRAGFAFIGEETGLAELVCERPAARPADRDADTYREGLDRYRDRDLGAAALARLDERRAAGPPAIVEPPEGVDETTS